MQYANPGETWIDWLAANDDQDDTTKLAALREIIAESARTWRSSGEITGAWANKKLAKLGIAERIDTENSYVLEVPATGTLSMTVYASNRAEALEVLSRRISNAAALTLTGVAVGATPVFTSGPEDIPQAGDPDAPTTVQATLNTLREILLLGNISGPRFNCDSGVSRVLASYGLAPVPARTSYTVRRPAAADMVTVVEAYDEATALRVADWRWEDGQKGFKATNVDPIDDLVIVPAAS